MSCPTGDCLQPPPGGRPGAWPGRRESAGVSGVKRPSSMSERSMVVHTSLLTEARSNQPPGSTPPTVRRYRISFSLNTWQTAEG